MQNAVPFTTANTRRIVCDSEFHLRFQPGMDCLFQTVDIMHSITRPLNCCECASKTFFIVLKASSGSGKFVDFCDGRFCGAQLKDDHDLDDCSSTACIESCSRVSIIPPNVAPILECGTDNRMLLKRLGVRHLKRESGALSFYASIENFEVPFGVIHSNPMDTSRDVES